MNQERSPQDFSSVITQPAILPITPNFLEQANFYKKETVNGHKSGMGEKPIHHERQRSLNNFVNRSIREALKITNNNKEINFIDHCVDTLIASYEGNRISDSQCVNAITKLRKTVYDRSQKRSSRINAADENVYNQQLEPEYLEDFIKILPIETFNNIGKILAKSAKEKKTTGAVVALIKHKYLAFTDDAVEALISCFIEAGLIKKLKRSYQLTDEAKRESFLGYAHLLETVHAAHVLSSQWAQLIMGTESNLKTETLDDYKKNMIEAQEKNSIPNIEIKSKKDSIRCLALSDILTGDKNSDSVVLKKIVSYIRNLPSDKKYDIIDVSGLIPGAFEIQQKKQRQALTGPYTHTMAQLQQARGIIRELQKTGAKIIYNISTEDLQEARQKTILQMSMLEGKGDTLSDSQKRHINYFRADALMYKDETRGTPHHSFDAHELFEKNVVFPFMLRSGRRLRSADELAKAGHIRVEEYIILCMAYEALRTGKRIPREYRRVLGDDIKYIPLPGKKFSDFEIVNGLKMTKDGELNMLVKHNMAFSEVPAYQNPTKDAVAYFKQKLAGDEATPKVFLMHHQSQGIVEKAGTTWIASTPSFQRERLMDEPDSASDVQNRANRQIHTRGIINTPGAWGLEAKPDGSLLIDILNNKSLDKKDLAKIRHHMFVMSDWQTGSPTAHPDLAVSFMDMMTPYLQKNEPIALAFNGDIIQGANYPGVDKELGPTTRLNNVDHQQQFVVSLLRRFFRAIPQDQLENIKEIPITPGNHERNSDPHRQLGTSHSVYLQVCLQDLLPHGDKRVNLATQAETVEGDFVVADVDQLEFGGYNFLIEHQSMVSGSSKGSGDKSAIYEAQALIEGVPKLLRPIDIIINGHRHNPACATFGDKIAVINPAIAGLSSFELARGYQAEIGGLIVHVGGGLAPQIEFISYQALAHHLIQNAGFSQAALAKRGFSNDPGFDPMKHGMYMLSAPKSALQKDLLKTTDQIVGGTKVLLG